MSQRRLILPAVLAAAALASGCADGAITEPNPMGAEPSDLFRSDAPPVTSAARGLDAEFLRISAEMPGFAGYFVDGDGVLNVRMAGAAQARSAAAVQQTLGRVAPLGLRIAAGQQVRVLDAKYDFAQLDAMHRAIGPVFDLDGVVFTDADEVRNRVVIGVTNGTARGAVERALAMGGVERAAIEIVETDPIVPMQTLQQRVRPVAGGLQINFPGFFCTLGFNVRAPQRPGVHGFVTNSHCTSNQGSMTSTPYWQNLSSTPDSFIGTEMHDVPFFTGGQCPAGRMCRWSDAAGVQYAPGVDVAFGRIYRTTGAGSLTIDGANPMWNIVAERAFPNVGDVLHKTGRTTGWTSGTVSQTCVNTGVSGTSITLLCQDWVQASVAGGDSGSPVFRRIGEGSDVELNGILWGGGTGVFVFSAMDNVRFENQGVVPWTTYAGQ
jgi:hypothetical protein